MYSELQEERSADSVGVWVEVLNSVRPDPSRDLFADAFPNPTAWAPPIVGSSVGEVPSVATSLAASAAVAAAASSAAQVPVLEIRVRHEVDTQAAGRAKGVHYCLLR